MIKKIPEYRTVSMCSTSEWCRGWNESIAQISQNLPFKICNENTDFSLGWNAAIEDYLNMNMLDTPLNDKDKIILKTALSSFCHTAEYLHIEMNIDKDYEQIDEIAIYNLAEKLGVTIY